MTFSQFDLQPALLKSLTELGYDAPTPIQAKTIPLLLEGHDVIGCAQTGTGKTAAFALPILQRLEPGLPGPQALIITPTRELAEQIDQNIKAYTRHLKKLSCQSVYGGVNINPQEARLRKGVDIVVATPGRLLDHLQRQSLSLNKVKYLVLDEADRMLDMGFLPDIKRILKQVPDQRQTLLFSATMPDEIRDLVKGITRQAKSVNVSPKNTTADSVEQCVFHVDKPNKLRLLTHLLETQSMYSVIVFSRTRHGADRIARQLGKQGLSVARIHADRSQNQRQQALDGFKQGKFQVLVATDIAARGIDVENISHVINFDTPTHAEDYVHRIGRTGRAQATGDAFTFTSPEEDKYLKAIEKLIGRRLPVADKTEYHEVIQPTAESAPSAPQARASAKATPAGVKAPAKTTQKAGTKTVNKSPGSRQPEQQPQQPKKQGSQPHRAEKAEPRQADRQADRQAQGGQRSQQSRQPQQAQPKRTDERQRQQPQKTQAQGQSRDQGKDQGKAQGREQNRNQGRDQSQKAQPQARQNQQGQQRQNQNAQGKAPSKPQGGRDGYVSRSGGGSLRVVKRSKGSYPLSGEVDYIDLDDEQPEQQASEQQPRNIDANDWGYPRNPVYEPWKNQGGQNRGSSQGPGNRDQNRGQGRGRRGRR